jgi:hypothetical protein
LTFDRAHLALLFAGLSTIAVEEEASAFEIVVVAAANDRGYADDVPLRYAESDADRILSALSELGRPRKIHRAVGGDAHSIQIAIAEARKDVDDARSAGQKTLLFFYYSGHADGDYLRVGGTRLTWSKLKELLSGTGAELSVSVIDACDSGSATSAKGAKFSTPLVTTAERLQATTGSMWITSSREDEASYESDEVGGSYFSHFLISGLRGAADYDEDGRVTLNEVYQFSYDRTVGETSLRLKKTQHPTYSSDLEGEGEIVLSEPQRSPTSLVLPRESAGRWFVAKRFGAKQSVLEVAKNPGSLVRFSVAAGSYAVYRKDLERIMLANVEVRAGEELVFDPELLVPYTYAEVMQKGGGIAIAAWHARLGPELRGPVFQGGQTTLRGTLSVRRRDRVVGFGVALDFGTHSFNALDTPVKTQELGATLFGEIFTELPWFTVGAQLGPSVLFARQVTNTRVLMSTSPGADVAVFVSRSLYTRTFISLEAGSRAYLVPLVDERSVELAPYVSAGLTMSLD